MLPYCIFGLKLPETSTTLYPSTELRGAEAIKVTIGTPCMALCEQPKTTPNVPLLPNKVEHDSRLNAKSAVL